MIITPVRTASTATYGRRVPSGPPLPTTPTSSEIPLDPSAVNFPWAVTPASRITRIPTARGLNGILPLPEAPVMTRAHFSGGDARPATNPSAIVVHSTAGGVGMSAQDWKRSVEQSGVGTQYFILKSGEIAEIQRADRQAWHVAASATNGTWNMQSVGIELVNGNTSPAGREPYTVAQLESLRVLVRHLATRFAIPRESIVMHRQLQPNDRTDPVGLPWHHFLRSVGHDRPWSGPVYQSGPDDPGIPAQYATEAISTTTAP